MKVAFKLQSLIYLLMHFGRWIKKWVCVTVINNISGGGSDIDIGSSIGRGHYGSSTSYSSSRGCSSDSSCRNSSHHRSGINSGSNSVGGSVRILSYSHSDQSGNSHVGAPVSHCQPRIQLAQLSPSHLTASIHRLPTLAHRLLLNHWCKIPTDESHSFPPPQPPAIPLSFSLTHSPSVPRATTINT